MDKIDKIILTSIIVIIFIICCAVSTIKGNIIIKCPNNTKEITQSNKTIYCSGKYYYDGMIINNIIVPLEILT
jgi:hypothetical protein